MRNVFLAHIGPLNTNQALLNATVYLSIVSGHVQHVKATIYPSYKGYIQHDNASCHKEKVVSYRFHEHHNTFSVLQVLPQSPNPNPTELWVKQE